MAALAQLASRALLKKERVSLPLPPAYTGRLRTNASKGYTHDKCSETSLLLACTATLASTEFRTLRCRRHPNERDEREHGQKG